LAVGEDDGTVRLWVVPRQKALGHPLRVNDQVQAVTFAEDGKRLLIGTAAGGRWGDLTGRKACQYDHGRPGRPKDRPPDPGEAPAVSPDGRTVATARRVSAGGRTRGRVELRDAATGSHLRQTPDQPHAPTGLAYSPDSKWLLTWGPGPGTARLWDVATLR